jgi:ABC-type branched-subunit amino acid transport system substrate-binding protein
VILGVIFGGVWFWRYQMSLHQNAPRHIVVKTSDAAVLPEPTLPTVRGVSDDKIILGMSADFSGANREKGRSIHIGVETYLKRVNAEGGVHGRQLVLIAEDDAYEPDRAEANFVKLVDKHQVFALIGNQGSEPSLQVAKSAVPRKVLLFGAATGVEALEKDPPDRYIFNYRARYSEEVVALAHYLVKRRGIRAQRVALFIQDDAYGHEVADDYQRALESLGVSPQQLKKMLVTRYTRNSVDIDDAVKATLHRRTYIDAVVIVATYRAAARYIHALRNKRFEPIFAAVSGVDVDALSEELNELAPKQAEAVIVSQVVPHTDSQASGVLQFREDLRRFAPQEVTSAFALEGYLVARIFAEGLKRADRTLTLESFVDTLESMRDFDLGTGAVCHFGPSHHQCTNKVWAVQLDADGAYHALSLD